MAHGTAVIFLFVMTALGVLHDLDGGGDLDLVSAKGRHIDGFPEHRARTVGRAERPVSER